MMARYAQRKRNARSVLEKLRLAFEDISIKFDTITTPSFEETPFGQTLIE